MCDRAIDRIKIVKEIAPVGWTKITHLLNTIA